MLAGTATAFCSAQHGMPGPGHYYTPSLDPAGIGRGAPAFSMGSRAQQQQQQAEEGGQCGSPGPGDYHR
jgi:hypothetical protein